MFIYDKRYNTALFIPLQRIIHFRRQQEHCRPISHHGDIAGRDAVTRMDYRICLKIAFEDSFYSQQTKRSDATFVYPEG